LGVSLQALAVGVVAGPGQQGADGLEGLLAEGLRDTAADKNRVAWASMKDVPA
jgi:hypothetical protein